MGVAAATALACNYLTFYATCKFICTTTTPLIATLFHAHVLKTGQPFNTGISLIQLSFLVVPWILYSSKSKIGMYFGVLFGTVCIFMVAPLNSLIEPKYETDIFYHPFLSNILIFTSCLIVTFCLYVNKATTNSYDIRNDQFNLASKEQNESLQKKETELILYIEEIKTKQEEDKKREWINVGIAKSSEILRQTNATITEFTLEVLRFLIKYSESNQGSFFILNDENEADSHLQLTACYAYNRQKHIDQRLEIGEGLVGTAFREKEIIYLTDVPQDFIKITSGLGDALPRCIIIVPLVVDDKAYGIVEMAYFQPLENHKIELLKILSENIASTIKNVKVNGSTKRLLENTQQQGEVLRAQEEEMRQNMEEMQATQEEMHRKQAENSEFQRMTNSIIRSSPGAVYRSHTDKNWTMIFISEKIFEILGYSPTEFTKNLVQLAQVTHPEDVLYVEKEVYQALENKTKYELNYRLKHKDSHYVYVWEIGEGVYDPQGNPMFIEGIILDVTEKKIKEEEMNQAMQQLQATQQQLLIKEQESENAIVQLTTSHYSMVDSLKKNELYLKKVNEELLNKQTSNSALINVAVRQAILGQKIGFYAEIVFKNNTPQSLQALAEAIDLHDQSLLVIKQGGLPPQLETAEPLEAAAVSLWPYIKSVEEVWGEIGSAARNLIQGCTVPETADKTQLLKNLEVIETKSETLLKLNNELLQKCIEWNKNEMLLAYN